MWATSNCVHDYSCQHNTLKFFNINELEASVGQSINQNVVFEMCSP